MRPGNRLIAICAAVGLGLASVSAWAGEVRQVLLNTGATGTRAEISLVGSGGYKTLSLAGPNRLVVDFPDSSAIRNLKMPAAQGVVTAVRTGQPVPGTFRVVFDLAESVAPFRPQMQREGNESKLVIEWPGDGPAVAASRPAVTPAVQPQAPVMQMMAGRLSRWAVPLFFMASGYFIGVAIVYFLAATAASALTQFLIVKPRPAE